MYFVTLERKKPWVKGNLWKNWKSYRMFVRQKKVIQSRPPFSLQCLFYLESKDRRSSSFKTNAIALGTYKSPFQVNAEKSGISSVYKCSTSEFWYGVRSPWHNCCYIQHKQIQIPRRMSDNWLLWPYKKIPKLWTT